MPGSGTLPIMTGIIIGVLAFVSPVDDTVLLRLKAKAGDRMVYEQYVASGENWIYQGFERHELTSASDEQLNWKYSTSLLPGAEWKVASDQHGQITTVKSPTSSVRTPSNIFSDVNLIPSQMSFPDKELRVGSEWSSSYKVQGKNMPVQYRLEAIEVVDSVRCARIAATTPDDSMFAEEILQIEIETGWLYQHWYSQKTPLGVSYTWVKRTEPVQMRLSGKPGDSMTLAMEHGGSTPTKGDQFSATMDLVSIVNGRYTWKTKRHSGNWTTVTDNRGKAFSVRPDDPDTPAVEGATNVPALIIFPENGLMPGDSWIHTHGVEGRTHDYKYTFMGSGKVGELDCWKIDGYTTWEDSHGLNKINLTLWYEKSNNWIAMSQTHIDYVHRGVASTTLVRLKRD